MDILISGYLDIWIFNTQSSASTAELETITTRGSSTVGFPALTTEPQDKTSLFQSSEEPAEMY